MTDGDQAPGVPLFLKQYGAKRTGTNYLRSLIRFNYAQSDVVPLMHILGDKHSPQPPLDELWRRAQDDDEPAFSFVMSATKYAPPASPSPELPRQRNAIRSIAAPLARAFREGSLRFLVSIKDPYAWVVSIARYEGWTDRGSPLGVYLAGAVAHQCAGFNACYAAWLALERQSPEHWHLVRHEDLLADPDRTLRELEAKFALRRCGQAHVDLPTEADAAIWDHDALQSTGVPFDRAYYLDKRYFARLPPLLVDVITRSIDWQLLGPLGYAPAEAR